MSFPKHKEPEGTFLGGSFYVVSESYGILLNLLLSLGYHKPPERYPYRIEPYGLYSML